MAATVEVKDIKDRTTQFMRIFITVSLISIWGFIIYTLLYRPVNLSDAVGNLLLVLVGILTREISTVVSFNFSSTASSQAKDETQRAQAETIASMAAPAAAATAAVIPAAVAANTDATVANTEATKASTAEDRLIAHAPPAAP